ncbi:MAG TPA: plastocyanin/azurin family copper-binding protein [Gemmatimonadales bacterium]|nr:plastocyanin/azurin family copper-binding protein [Gemmatimonadales bacterium]
MSVLPRVVAACLLAVLPWPAQARAQATTRPPQTARVHVVAMVERGQYGIAFEPQRTFAAPGDTLRFVQQGALPHNVQFRSAPAGAALEGGIESPMMTDRGSTFDVVLDARFVPGKYHFVCVPHEAIGMAGLLYVDAQARTP